MRDCLLREEAFQCTDANGSPGVRMPCVNCGSNIGTVPSREWADVSDALSHADRSSAGLFLAQSDWLLLDGSNNCIPPSATYNCRIIASSPLRSAHCLGGNVYIASLRYHCINPNCPAVIALVKKAAVCLDKTQKIHSATGAAQMLPNLRGSRLSEAFGRDFMKRNGTSFSRETCTASAKTL